MTNFPQYTENKNSQNPDAGEDEISLIDLLIFLKSAYKIIVGFALFGIMGAALYLSAIPKQYEAIAKIKMGQINKFEGIRANINPNGINIEEPQVLISRMSAPTSYPRETIALCGLADQKDAEFILASEVKLSIPKGVGGIVDLKYRDTSKEAAMECANAVYQLIKTSQAQLLARYIDETDKKLKLEEERLSQAIQMMVNADKSGVTESRLTYLMSREEIRYLQDQIARLQNVIAGNESRAAHLIAPIYVKNHPVSPNKYMSLIVGLLLGGLLGLGVCIARGWYRSNCGALNR